jgi:hypothetical protein
LISESAPVLLTEEVRRRGGLAVLAHPQRLQWRIPAELIQAVDAVEIWNVGYDGKYVPTARALREYQKMRQANPRLLAVAGQDFHRPGAFYDVSIEMDLPGFSAKAILEGLRKGDYQIRSRFFGCDSRARLSRTSARWLGFLSWQLQGLRKARDTVWRWSA